MTELLKFGTDVLLLSDVLCLDYYGLDRSHYFSSPGLSWDSMSKMTGIKLQTLSDINVHNFIEKGMRGGISYICKRHIKANNKYMKNYDSNKESEFIMYWDMYNLYGWGIINYLPNDEFEFLTKREINKFDLDFISKNSSIGYILGVDLKYCDELHDFYSDYPLCPEKVEISLDILSKYCSDIANKYGIKFRGVNKLVPNLRDKKNIYCSLQKSTVVLKIWNEVD